MKKALKAVMVLLIIALTLMSVCLSEQEGWDCPGCGRTGLTGNFCGHCGTKRPETKSSSTTEMDETQTNISDMTVQSWTGYEEGINYVIKDQGSKGWLLILNELPYDAKQLESEVTKLLDTLTMQDVVCYVFNEAALKYAGLNEPEQIMGDLLTIEHMENANEMGCIAFELKEGDLSAADISAVSAPLFLYIIPVGTDTVHTHIAVVIPGYAETCTTTGLTDGSRCSVCGEILSEQTVIPATGHTPQTVKGYAATCSNTGLTDGSVCASCGATLKSQQTIAKLPHTEVNITGYPATCSKTGLTDGKKCSVCGTVTKKQQTISMLPHSLTHVDAQTATKSADGYEAYDKCTNCSYSTFAGWIHLTPGAWSSWTTTVVSETNRRDVETSTQYRYRNKTTQTTQNQELSGATLISTTYEYGSWSDWSDSTASASGTLEVETRTVDVTQQVTKYSYSRYRYINKQGNWNSAPVDASNPSSGLHNYLRDGRWEYDTVDAPKAISRVNSWNGYTSYAPGGGYAWWNESISTETIVTGTKTQYRTRSKTTVRVYEIWSSWSDWSSTRTEGTQVESRTIYRYRDYN